MGTRSAPWLVTGVFLAWSAAAAAAPAASAASEAPEVPAMPAKPVGPAAPTVPAVPAVPGGPSAIPEPPDEMKTLQLTELQRRILEQVFHQHKFETPAPPPPSATFGVKVDPLVPGGAYRLGAPGDLPAQLLVTVRSVQSPAAIRLTYLVQDFYGRKVAGGDLPPVFPDRFGMAAADLTLKEVTTAGYYHVLVTALSEESTAAGACGIAIVQAGETIGPDVKSQFGLAGPAGKVSGTLAETARRLGARHMAVDWTDAPALDAVRKAGLIPTPIVRLGMAQQNLGPGAFATAMAEQVQANAETLPDWQIGRRPVFTDLDADAVNAYRQAVSGVLEAVRRAKSPVTLWVTVPPDILADVLTEGPVLAGADGIALCVDAGAEAPNLSGGAYRRSLDYGIQVARRMGIKRIELGETGDEPVASPQQQAWKLVTRHVLALAAGVERVYVSCDRGVPEPIVSAAAYATMTHLLDGAAYQGSPWEDVPLVQAHLFAGLERRVAVVWSWAGEDPAKPDAGALVFDRGAGIEALDVMGYPVGIWKGERLIVPLGEAPIYLVSSELKTNDLRDRLRGARIMGVAPAVVYVQSIVRGERPGRVSLTLLVQSLRPYKMNGMAGLRAPEGWTARQAKQQFALEAGQGREVTFECDVPAAQGAGPFPVEAVVSLNEEYVRHTQDVWVAQTPQRSVEVGYGLAAWEGIEPVVAASAAGDVRAEVRTAWDANNFYFCAAVQRQRTGYKPGKFDFDGDAIQLGWGLEPRADDDFGHKARDLALPPGAFRDTDHLMAIAFSKDGPQVVRLRQPRAALRAHYPGNLDAWYGPVEGAVAEIARDQAGGRTIYEAAIPLKALAPLKGERGRLFRFGFRIGDAGRPPLEWARAAAVPDCLANPCSFLPTSFADGLPCQTWWGMIGPVKPGQRND
jgi:hypothetical protein